MTTKKSLSTLARIFCAAGLLIPLLAGGCAQAPSGTSGSQPAASQAGTSAGPISDTIINATEQPTEETPAAAATTSLLDQPSPVAAETTINLTLWTVADVSEAADGEAATIFGNGLRAFEQAYPGVTVSAVLKNDSGKGSILDYLKTASQVAPSVLPDIVILNTSDLADANRTGTLVPLEELIDTSLEEDLLPSALAAGTVEGHLVGIPFEMDVEHIAYNTNKVNQAPLNWTDVLSRSDTYLFPAKGRNGLVNDAFLVQYLALGGQLQDEDGRPVINEQMTLAVLDFYQQGADRGVIPVTATQASTVEDVWPIYLSAEVDMANVSSHQYLRDRESLRATQFAAIPTRDGNPLTICRGRALVITTRDPAQQASALRLISWMLETDNIVAWSQAAYHLPPRYSAFDQLSVSDPYWTFAQQQMEAAVPPPAFTGYDQVGRVLQQAVTEVFSGESTPAEAAAAAFDAIPR